MYNNSTAVAWQLERSRARKSSPVSKVISKVQSRTLRLTSGSALPASTHLGESERSPGSSLDQTLDRTLDRNLDQSEVLRNVCSMASAAAAFRALTPSLLSPAVGRGVGGSVAWASSSESEFSSS